MDTIPAGHNKFKQGSAGVAPYGNEDCTLERVKAPLSTAGWANHGRRQL